MPLRRSVPLAGLLLLLRSTAALAEETTLTFSGEVEGAPDHAFVPFEVPAGTVEIEVRHASLEESNVLDFGVDAPGGFRGWGGGNSEPAVIGVDAASRSYLAGPIAPGTWRVVIGKAKLKVSPAPYSIEIILRDTPTLAPQPERKPYAPAPALEVAARFYAGDFHVHSRESGDARPPLDEVATFARSRGLDFVEISDHNTVSHLDFFVDAQARHPKLLLVPGVEYTTYAGHANGIGATVFVDHKVGQPGVTIEGAADAFAAQGAIVAINHPALEVGSLCIGCAWKQELAPSKIGAVEIATVGWSQAGSGVFTRPAIALWDELSATGARLAPIGGSDDHRAGVELGAFQSPIGDPTTMVFAEELSAAGIVEGVRRGRTVVKLQGPGDPMVELRAGEAMAGDTVTGRRWTLRIEVTGGVGSTLELLKNGQIEATREVDADPFVHELPVDAPASGEDRYRAEVLVDGAPRTITSHLWLQRGDGPDEPSAPPAAGCGCAVAPAKTLPAALALSLLGALAAWRRARRRRAR